MEEERRLAYVGMTRARERLVLTHATSRSLWGNRAFDRRVALPRRAARRGGRARAAAAGVLVELRRTCRAAARGRARSGDRRLGSARDDGRRRRRARRAGRRGDGALRRRRSGAQADARVRAAGEDRLMEIRTCTTADELRDAATAIVHYFGRDKPDGRGVGPAVAGELRARTDARGPGGRRHGRRGGGSLVPADRPRAACCRPRG